MPSAREPRSRSAAPAAAWRTRRRARRWRAPRRRLRRARARPGPRRASPGRVLLRSRRSSPIPEGCCAATSRPHVHRRPRPPTRRVPRVAAPRAPRMRHPSSPRRSGSLTMRRHPGSLGRWPRPTFGRRLRRHRGSAAHRPACRDARRVVGHDDRPDRRGRQEPHHRAGLGDGGESPACRRAGHRQAVAEHGGRAGETVEVTRMVETDVTISGRGASAAIGLTSTPATLHGASPSGSRAVPMTPSAVAVVSSGTERSRPISSDSQTETPRPACRSPRPRWSSQHPAAPHGTPAR